MPPTRDVVAFLLACLAFPMAYALALLVAGCIG